MSGVGSDIRRSFIGRGVGDERCTEAEIERLLRDAADERHDGGTVDLDPERCFDDASLRWYRKHFEDRNPGRDESLSQLEFLHHWGFVIEAGDRLRPTRAAVLLFGTEPAFRQLLPRPVVDWQWSRGNWSEELAEERWADRLVIETNLVKTWRALIGRYLQRAEKPFSIDPGTLQRDDRPPDYIAFREGVINLLIHQDYADHTRKPAIRSFDDRVIMWNPGDAFAGARELLDPVEKEVRNPRIVAAFRRSRSERAGRNRHSRDLRQLAATRARASGDRQRQGAESLQTDPVERGTAVRGTTPVPGESRDSPRRGRGAGLRLRLPGGPVEFARCARGRRTFGGHRAFGPGAVGGAGSHLGPGRCRDAGVRRRRTPEGAIGSRRGPGRWPN